VQYVSSTPATRLDVINLQEQLDQRLLQRQARETGICPVREELYAQCFDELIRQVTINCAERGLLLLRVRDEIRMTIAAYQTLYESSIAFGMRKALQAEQGKADMEMRIKQLEQEKKELERQVQELKDEIAKCEDQLHVEQVSHAAQVKFLEAKIQKCTERKLLTEQMNNGPTSSQTSSTLKAHGVKDPKEQEQLIELMEEGRKELLHKLLDLQVKFGWRV
jgi:dynein light intermediate chain